MATEQDDQPEVGSLADKLDRLFQTVRSPAGREYTHEEVAAALRDAGGPTISAQYVWQLRRGHRTNPRMSHLEALARHFQVDPAYFFPGELADHMAEELEAVAALRDPTARTIAVHAAILSPASRGVLGVVADRLLGLEAREA